MFGEMKLSVGDMKQIVGKMKQFFWKSKFDGEMKQHYEEMKQNLLQRCPIGKMPTTLNTVDKRIMSEIPCRVR